MVWEDEIKCVAIIGDDKGPHRVCEIEVES